MLGEIHAGGRAVAAPRRAAVSLLPSVKPQNMSNNAGRSPTMAEEIGRAQALQADCLRTAPIGAYEPIFAETGNRQRVTGDRAGTSLLPHLCKRQFQQGPAQG